MTPTGDPPIVEAPGAPRIDRAISWLNAGIFAVTFAVLILAALTYPRVVGVDSGVEAQLEANEIAGCRSQSSARVTDARTAFDVARATRDTEATHLSLLIAEGLVAAVTDDEPTLIRVLGEIGPARERVATAEQRVVKATEHLNDTNTRHKERVQLSIDDPDGFRDLCDELDPSNNGG